MTSRGTDAVLTGLVLATSAMSMASGCGRLRIGIADGRGSRPVEPGWTEEVPLPAAEPECRKTALAAIEEFLQRTEDYRLASVMPVETTPPPVPATADSTARVDTEVVTEPATMSSDSAGRQAAPRDEAFANQQVALVDTPLGGNELALPAVESAWIRPATASVTPHAEQGPATTSNQPLDAQASRAPADVETILRHLELQAEEAADVDSEWRLRLARLALGRDAGATEIPEALPSDARCILSAAIEVVRAGWRAARDPLTAGEEAVTRAEELVHVLADRADPIVSAVALCRKVVTFGVYDEMGEGDVTAGRTAQTIVYCEVRNFRSERTGEGLHRTVLATRLEVLTADGRSVWQREEPEIVDLCRRRRTDFFIAQRATLPPTLPAGDYVLKVLVEDKLSGRANEVAHPFRIGSGASVAAGFENALLP